MSGNAKKTYFIALGGVLAALSMVFMFFSSIVPIAELVLPAMAGVLLICAVYEMGEGWAFLIFAAVGLLSLLLPTKDTAIYYIFFLGHYPILKSFIERIKSRPLCWIAKLAVFNVCAWAALFVSMALFSFSGNVLKYGYVIIALLMNVTFVVYDIALSGLTVFYETRLHKIVHRH